jgi:rod shape determining protein RodA
MFARLKIYLKNFDWILFAPVLLLVCLGLAEIYSIGLSQEEASLQNFKKQMIAVAIGLILLFVFSFLDYRDLRGLSVYFYILGIIVLVAVLFFGSTIRGTKGWFSFAGFGFQPVEMIKIILILFLARYFSESSFVHRPLKHLIISGGGALILVILVLLQPDLGSALLLCSVWLAMVIAAGLNKKYLFILIIIVALMGSLSWSFYLKPYQKERVSTFLNPSFDPLNQGYNVAQAVIAVGAGGLTGRGIGFGSQSQLKFLPESHTDFIFAVLAEELGLLGVSLFLLGFVVFFYRLLWRLKNIDNDFGIFFIYGGASLIFIEMFVNISMNIGLLPVVGISLPFLSYGGSGVIANLILVGIMESIIIRSRVN